MEFSRVSVIRGSCLAASALPSLPDQSIDVVITDPPYSEHVHSNARTNAKEAEGGVHVLDFAHLKAKTRTLAARQFARLARRWVLVFCAEEDAHLWRGSLEDAGLEYVRTGRWCKENPMPQKTGDRPAQGDEAIVICHAPRVSGRMHWNGGGRTAVYHAALANVDGKRLHKAQKPLGLMEALVRDFSDHGELVLDPFAGSGSTGVAALKYGRRFLGYERDAKHCRVARERLRLVREQLGLFPEMPTVGVSDDDTASFTEAKEQGHGM